MLVYFADAFAWRYWQETDFMPGFWHVHRPLQTLLGYSSTILPCLLSGRYPRETGVWTEYYRSPRPQTKLERALTASALLATPVNLARLVLFRIARKRGHPAAHLLRIPLQFSHLFQRHPIDYHRFPPLELPVPTIDRVLEENALRLDVRHVEERTGVTAELDRMRSCLNETDVFFYIDNCLDERGHRVGPVASRLKPEMGRIGDFLERAWDLLAQTGNPEMFLFSDHGMTEVKETFDLLSALHRFRLGQHYLVFIDSTLARFWFPDPEQRREVISSLAHAPGHLLSKEEIRWCGIDFDDNRYGEEILVANEGVVFHPNYISPSFLHTRRYPDRATHGYWPTVPSAYGIFAYRGSRSRADIPEPVPAVDIFEIIRGVATGWQGTQVRDEPNGVEPPGLMR